MATAAQAVKPVHASRDEEGKTAEELATEQQAAEKQEEELEEAVEIEEPENTPEKPLDPRQEIAQKYEQRRQEQMEAQSQSEEEATGQGQETSGEQEAEPPAPEMVEIKVNDRTLNVEKDKVDKAGGVQAYQKQVAVSDGFQENARRRKELDGREHDLEGREAELARREQALADKEHNAPPQSGEHQQTTTRTDLPTQGDQSKQRAELIKKHREALIDGDDETADQLMEQLLQPIPQQPTQGFDKTELVNETVEQIEARQQAKANQQSAKQALSDAHSDWEQHNADPNYWAWVDSQSEGTRLDAESLDPAAVSEVLTKYKEDKGLVQKEAEPEQELDTSGLDRKTAEKRAMNRPRAATGRAKAPPPPKAPSRSDVVQKMREQRGQV